MQRSRFSRQTPDSKTLENRLKMAVEKHHEVEQNYRETNQRFWTILFIDVSDSAELVWKQGEAFANQVFSAFQERVRDILQQFGSCFIEPGGGPQIVCCFDKPKDGLLAAHAILEGTQLWNEEQRYDFELIPAVGIHQGYIVYHDGLIHQSNTNNMAKRIQTQAQPGQIFVSSAIYEKLKNCGELDFTFIRTAKLKNIPVPQDIYQATILTPPGDRSVASDKETLSTPGVSPPAAAPVLSSRKDEEKQINQFWAFVYIDVCESTKKFWSFGDREASALIKEYQKVCHTTFKNCGCCYVLSCEGDQIIAAFDANDTHNAVMAAIKILQFLFRRNTRVPIQKQVRAALGIHIGDVGFIGKDLVQTKDMRVGKEIQSQATADEILISLQVADLLGDDITACLENAGEFKFTGIPDSYTLFNLNWVRVPVRVKQPKQMRKPFYKPR
jgi:class 3 adenylate cyclase